MIDPKEYRMEVAHNPRPSGLLYPTVHCSIHGLDPERLKVRDQPGYPRSVVVHLGVTADLYLTIQEMQALRKALEDAPET